MLASNPNSIMKAFWTLVFRYGVVDADTSNPGCGGTPYNNGIVMGPGSYTAAGIASPWDAVIANLKADPNAPTYIATTQGNLNGYRIFFDFSKLGFTVNDLQVVKNSCAQYWVTGVGSC